MSRDLLMMGLGPLNGKSGIVIQLMLDNKTPGAMVKLDERTMDYFLWFIPIKSLSTGRTKNKQANLKLITETLL